MRWGLEEYNYIVQKHVCDYLSISQSQLTHADKSTMKGGKAEFKHVV